MPVPCLHFVSFCHMEWLWKHSVHVHPMWLIQQQCDADQSPCQILPSKPGPFWVHIALHFIQEHLADILSKCQVWQGPWGRASSLPIDGLSDFSTQRIIQDLCSGYRGWINLDQDLWFCHTASCSWMIRIESIAKYHQARSHECQRFASFTFVWIILDDSES